MGARISLLGLPSNQVLHIKQQTSVAKQPKFIFSQFRRLEIWDQDASTVGFL